MKLIKIRTVIYVFVERRTKTSVRKRVPKSYISLTVDMMDQRQLSKVYVG